MAITLAAKGGVRAPMRGLIADNYPFEVVATDAVDVVITADEIVLTFPAIDGRMSVRVSVPAAWQAPASSETFTLIREGDSVRLNVQLPCDPLRFRRAER